MFHNTFPMLSQGDQGKGVPPQLWYVLLVQVVYKRIRLGHYPICRDSRFNHMFRNTFPMRDN